MPMRPPATGRLRAAVNRAELPKEACACKRSLTDVEALKTGLKDPALKWKRLCVCGAHHYYGDLKS